MTPEERVRATYRREPVDRIAWEPRLEHWFRINKAAGTLPARYATASLLDIYDDLGASVRYGLADLLRCEEGRRVRVETARRGDEIVTRWSTPKGELVQVQRLTYDGSATVRYAVREPGDLDTLEYILRERRWSIDRESFERERRHLAGRCLPAAILPRVHLQRLFIDWMGFERTIQALYEAPQKMEGFLASVDRADDPLFDLLAAGPFEMINFGDNIHCDMLPPPLFERYVLPTYQRRTEQLRRAGKFTCCHWDGNVKALLPYARKCGFDALEAITFHPQGDVHIEETRQAFGDDIILIDGLPAVLFLPQTPQSDLVETTRRVIEAFEPRLILGISDELPPGGDLERVELVARIVRDYRPPATADN